MQEKMSMNVKTYSELIRLPTFEERFEYLKLSGHVGTDTFGFDRVFNQMFYRSKIWKNTRRNIILRDMGNDLGIEGRGIVGKILIHHMNPISLDDIQNSSDYLLNPNYLICVSHITHNAIHYGSESPRENILIERTPNDTCLWKR